MMRNRLSIITASFVVGMLLFSLESVFTAISFQSDLPEQVRFWHTLTFLTKSLLAGVWLCFSLSYSRGNYREFLTGSRFLLFGALLLPVCLLPALRIPFVDVLGSGPDWWLAFSRPAKI